MILVVGDRYKHKQGSIVVIYLGHNWSRDGYWHQFARVEEPNIVWTEFKASGLRGLEHVPETVKHEEHEEVNTEVTYAEHTQVYTNVTYVEHTEQHKLEQLIGNAQLAKRLLELGITADIIRGKK